MHVVTVTGGRDYKNRSFVYMSLSALHKKHHIDLLVHGGATGVDSFAERWAASKEINCTRVPAKWRLYGRSAGPMRNLEMLDMMEPLLHKCTLVVFPGNKGTQHMHKEAKRRSSIDIIDLTEEAAG